jgi:L-iditol 2-dehydrogenase
VRAALLSAPHSIALEEVGESPLRAGDAVVRVGAVGVCGTDLSIYAGKIPVTYPRVLGHEIVGELLEPGSSGLSSGTAVIVDPGLACGVCVQCREGRSNICTAGGLLGRDVDGGLRETLTINGSHVYALPDAIDGAVAPLLQVLATCVHAQRLIQIFPGDSVVVLGLGVTGLLHLQLARLRGARAVIGVTRSAEKLALAERLGADVVIRADGTESDAVIGSTESGADVVIECAGTPTTFARALEMARVGGRILAYGTITASEGALSYYDLYYKELAIMGARSARAEDFPAAIDAVATGDVSLEPLISERFPLEATGEALDTAGAPGVLKVIIDV